LEFSGSEHLVASSSQQNSQLKMRRSMIWVQLQNLAESGFGLMGPFGDCARARPSW
jgi:hypothetical protein